MRYAADGKNQGDSSGKLPFLLLHELQGGLESHTLVPTNPGHRPVGSGCGIFRPHQRNVKRFRPSDDIVVRTGSGSQFRIFVPQRGDAFLHFLRQIGGEQGCCQTLAPIRSPFFHFIIVLGGLINDLFRRNDDAVFHGAFQARPDTGETVGAYVSFRAAIHTFASKIYFIIAPIGAGGIAGGRRFCRDGSV